MSDVPTDTASGGGSSKSSKPRRHRDPRHHFRARSHASAHAGEHARPQAIPEHPLIPKNTASLVTTQDELRSLLDHLRAAGEFAYDSEFIGELSYHPKLCLIQVATRERVTLVDPLAGLDLTGFWALVADPAIEKVVHAGQQDLEPVCRLYGQPPANVFDTQIAAGFIGLAYPVGLSKLVRELVKVQLGKGFTFTHWDQRPLSAVQMRYAADDVRYLPALRDAIGKRLEQTGHIAWAKAECDAQCDPAVFRADPGADCARIRGAGALPSLGLAVLRELLLWRDEAARRHDAPPRSLVKDEVLLEMARHPVKSVEGLAKVRGLPRPVEEEEGKSIVTTIARGLAVPEADRPIVQNVEETPPERFAIDSLWATAQAWCAGQSVDPALVSSRAEISKLYREVKGQGVGSSNGRLSRGWRGELLGEKLNGFLSGNASLQFSWRDGGLRSTPAQ
jgi:ribonuclease D